MFFGTIVDKNTVEKLGQNFGVQGFNGTGPFCWVLLDAAIRGRTDASMPATIGDRRSTRIPSPQVDRVIWRVIPDRQHAHGRDFMSGQGDVTQYIPFYAARRR